MQDVTRELVDLLDLAPVGNDHFSGDSQDLGFPSVFGGQVLGQALMAASRTVDDRLAHSLHAYFLRPGDAREPIDYEVNRVRDGGSFSTRRVMARQSGKEILTAIVSFQVEEEGLEHQFEMPAAPGYETLNTELDLRRKLEAYMPERSRELLLKERAIEIRPVNPGDPLKPSVERPHKQHWMRALGELPDDPTLHRCLLAYASDFGLLGTSINPHGVTFMDPRLQVASLDHAIWFHREFRMDQWLLYDMDSPSSSGGRGFSRGNIFDPAGRLVASTTQEALIRKHMKS
ncbi:acyl-CoA thioesterase II [Hydrocarboniclastica marina]|uniref:Acyl-CoA thioesterase 2 n=1 Tax=Hydrocarboniclastica marina TaxID=2259620 RepID=A0A4P7XJL0_9ALTE|nr:acyl-CoA thioesterase II [Hydrocarboniclastica marina]MAL97424.1 acyl-CoA thioesterase II [Alteromonadaceae bacterium]QCF27316.1 acyl-CoA thioesterase II [Hydrocarboniclastica marina]